MDARTYCVVSATLFTIVASGHLMRILNAWPMVVGSIEFPMLVSWLGVIVPGTLAAWGFRTAARKRS